MEKELAEKVEKEFWTELQDRLDRVKQKPLPYEYQEPELAWKTMKKKTTAADFEQSPLTGIKKASVDKIIKHLMTIPEGFSPLGKVNRLLKGKQKLLDKKPIGLGHGRVDGLWFYSAGSKRCAHEWSGCQARNLLPSPWRIE